MKRNPDFLLTTVGGDYMLVPTGASYADMSRVVYLNDLGHDLWEKMENDTTVEALARQVVEEYEVGYDEAFRDITGFVDVLRKNGCLVEKESV